MKTCPTCNTRYTDKSLLYCLQDGALLLDPSEPETEVFDTAAFAQQETIAATPAVTDANKENELKRDSGDPLSAGASQPTLERPKNRSAGFGFFTGLLAGAGILAVIVAVGAAVWLVPGYLNDQGNTNANKNPKRPVKVTNEMIGNVTASSFRRPYKGILYVPENAIDGEDRTAWGDGVAGAGKGEWIKVTFTEPLELNDLTIKPGYFKTASIWKKNNRVASVRLQFSNGQNRIFDFPDVMKTQKVDLKGVVTSFVKIYLNDVYLGTTDYTDTMISEISFTALK